MEKVELFTQIFDSELPKHSKRGEAFLAANQRFETETRLSGYSDYTSYLNTRRKKRK